MPELPEIEHLRRTLAPAVIGTTVTHVDLRRADIVRPQRSPQLDGARGHAPTSASSRPRLLRGEQIVGIDRRGKELALIGESNRAIAVHLGMSGQLLLLAKGRRPADPRHVHCAWRLRNGASSYRLIFRDPRRFGGLWSIDSVGQLHRSHWNQLGPDALTISTSDLLTRLQSTRRAIKTVLLDQRVIAGVGNIYADEALHAAGIHPLSRACDLDDAAAGSLQRAVRAILRAAIRAGGSTIRDYRDGGGTPGTFASRHAVYGRSGQACRGCGGRLASIQVAQRTTTFCPSCQASLRGSYSQGAHTIPL